MKLKYFRKSRVSVYEIRYEFVTLELEREQFLNLENTMLVVQIKILKLKGNPKYEFK